MNETIARHTKLCLLKSFSYTNNKRFELETIFNIAAVTGGSSTVLQITKQKTRQLKTK